MKVLVLGGDVLAPGRPERPVQFIDARALAEWCVRLAEARRAAAFNAYGPAATLTMGALLETGTPLAPEREAALLARAR